ncbi:NAD-dependent epimerase/dehydratase family protein [Halomarina ordinaria]|uniref:NAD-dependent epimerase/dehydratase family protein n=1 Tax=Halomarina ordinaria TaxID=3033939 RepID=A0ABD5UI09_9EURY|nr:NAD-dependent epimerase/dehydratase family protein [Halomarina sp. PSRA2]
MSERALVTGATGFLGSHLCEALVEEGWDVTGTRRPTSDATALADVDMAWRTMDVLDPDSVRAAVEGHDVVFHLAGIGLQAGDAATVERVNRDGTEHVLAASEADDVERVVFTSTAGTRRAAGVASEADVARPIGAYQRGKAAAEELCDEYGDRGLDVVTVHPTSIFGPRDDDFTGRLFTLVENPLAVVHPPGGASFVGVSDVVDGTVAAAERGEAGAHYILGGENLTYAEALTVIATLVGGRKPAMELPPALIRAAGPVVGVVNDRLGTRMFPFDGEMARLSTKRLFYSSEKAREDLGYTYQPLRDLVPDAWAWYRNAAGR